MTWPVQPRPGQRLTGSAVNWRRRSDLAAGTVRSVPMRSVPAPPSPRRSRRLCTRFASTIRPWGITLPPTSRRVCSVSIGLHRASRRAGRCSLWAFYVPVVRSAHVSHCDMSFHALSNRNHQGIPYTGMLHTMIPDLPCVTALTRSSCRSTYLRSKDIKASLYDNHINLEGFRYADVTRAERCREPQTT